MRKLAQKINKTKILAETRDLVSIEFKASEAKGHFERIKGDGGREQIGMQILAAGIYFEVQYLRWYAICGPGSAQ